MIIDVHTHTPRFRDEVPPHLGGAVEAKWSPGKARPTVYTWQEFLVALASVDRAIVFNIAADPRQLRPVNEPYVVSTPTVNDETAAFVNAYPDKFIGFMAVHPHAPGAVAEMDRCRAELGLRGLKLGLNYQNVDPLSTEAFALFRYAEQHRLPVLLHQGTSPVRFADVDYAHPRHTDRIAMAFPDLPIIMAHIGHPFVMETIAVVRKHPNVWADVSGCVLRPWMLYQALVGAMEWGVLDQLLFGSDFPASTPEETIAKLRAVNEVAGPGMPRIPETAIEGIITRDSLPLLGLS